MRLSEARLWGSKTKHRRKGALAIAVMLGLRGEIIPDCLNSHTPDAPCEITPRPQRWRDPKFVAQGSGTPAF